MYRLLLLCAALAIAACTTDGGASKSKSGDTADAQAQRAEPADAGRADVASDAPRSVSNPAIRGPVVARINGQEITQGELEDWMKEELFRREVVAKAPGEAYEARLTALNQMIAQRALESQAKARETSVETLVQEEMEAIGDITDEQVRGFYDDNRERIGSDEPFEKLAPQIRQFLDSRRADVAASRLVARADTSVFLRAPRSQVRAAGPSMGPDDAPVTVIEFSDFQCPYCSRAQPTMNELRERYPTQVRVVYRHLPLSFHNQALSAAIASVCADEQGQFWEFHDQLFANQRNLGKAKYLELANQLSLDQKAFDSCIAGSDAAEKVQADIADAQRAGLTGTPAFFVNGILLSGARPLEDFVEIIESELRTQAEGS